MPPCPCVCPSEDRQEEVTSPLWLCWCFRERKEATSNHRRVQTGQLLQNLSLIHLYRGTVAAFQENAVPLSCLLQLHPAVLFDFLSITLSASCFYQPALGVPDAAWE